MVLGALISHPELLSRDTLYELRSIVARFPYFQTARLLMLKNLYLLHDAEFGAELRRSVLYVSDRRALCRLIEGGFDRVVDDETETLEEPTVDRTMSLIDAFLGTLPEELSAMPVAAEAVGDYATRFLNDEQEDTTPATASSDDTVLRALELIAQGEPSGKMSQNTPPSGEPTIPEVAGNALTTDEESLEEGYFTETLAKIYIKQRKYSRALEIIRSLYLQFPEKNVYFADQIRFLEKLIINNNLK